MLNNKISRLQKDIETLESQRSKSMNDENDSIKKINRAYKSIKRTKNISTIKRKEKEIQRENDKIQKSKKAQSDLSRKISNKNNQLNTAISNLNKERKKEQERILKEQERKIRESKQQQKLVVDSISTNSESYTTKSKENKIYDVFISHSSEDKDDYVDELASALKQAGIKVWYDSDTIGWGESIRQKIDKGLIYSKFGIVILSPSFITRYWTEYELDGILRKEASSGIQTILPIWHNLTAEEVMEYSYSLSDRVAMITSIDTIDEVVDNVKRLVNY